MLFNKRLFSIIIFNLPCVNAACKECKNHFINMIFLLNSHFTRTFLSDKTIIIHSETIKVPFFEIRRLVAMSLSLSLTHFFALPLSRSIWQSAKCCNNYHECERVFSFFARDELQMIIEHVEDKQKKF